MIPHGIVDASWISTSWSIGWGSRRTERSDAVLLGCLRVGDEPCRRSQSLEPVFFAMVCTRNIGNEIRREHDGWSALIASATQG